MAHRPRHPAITIFAREKTEKGLLATIDGQFCRGGIFTNTCVYIYLARPINSS